MSAPRGEDIAASSVSPAGQGLGHGQAQAQAQEHAKPHADERITLIGVGAIGISFLALHLSHSAATVSVYDPRPDLQEHLEAVLPLYLPSTPGLTVAELLSSKRLRLCTTLAAAVRDATIVQEQGPEDVRFKQRTWDEVIRHVSPTTHLWSSTSGLPASQQLAHLDDSKDDGGNDSILSYSARARLLIVHPFNPPHIMPLLELVPSPSTAPAELDFAKTYFTALNSGHRPITIHRETVGFVANRLAYVLFREACHLVDQGVVSVGDVDEIVRASLGPRWAVAGPFKMYGFGGGKKGMLGFLENIGKSIRAVWEDQGQVEMGAVDGLPEDGDGEGEGEGNVGWKAKIVQQTDAAYGTLTADDVRARDRALRAVLSVQEEMQPGPAGR